MVLRGVNSMSDIPRNCKVCGCLFDVPSAKISIEHCIMKELNTTFFLCVDCASKLIKHLQINSIDHNSINEVNSNLEKIEEHGKKISYSTVNVGSKIWMAENLAYDDGGNGIYYNPKNKEYYYTWEAANRIARKLGWKLPTNKDWDKACENTQLKEKLKLDGYYDYYTGEFICVDCYGFCWSASESSSKEAWCMYFGTVLSLNKNYYSKTYGFSVRLVKDS